jgi:hypothetical protein
MLPDLVLLFYRSAAAKQGYLRCPSGVDPEIQSESRAAVLALAFLHLIVGERIPGMPFSGRSEKGHSAVRSCCSSGIIAQRICDKSRSALCPRT